MATKDGFNPETVQIVNESLYEAAKAAYIAGGEDNETFAELDSLRDELRDYFLES